MAGLGPRGLILGVATVSAAVITSMGIFIWNLLPLVPELELSAQRLLPYDNAMIHTVPVAFPLVDADGIRFAVLREPENERVTAPGEYDRGIASWRTLLSGLGAIEVPPAEAGVLVVPRSRCLGGANRRLIADHLAAGRGLVSTGVMGSADGQCQALRDTLLVDLLGGGRSAPFTSLALPRIGSDYAVVLGETVLGAHLPPGARIEIRPAHQIVFRGSDREVFYTTVNHEPRPMGGETFFDGSALRARVGGGRLIAFGFDIDELGDPWSRSVMRGVVANAMTWAAGQPIAEIAPWPNGKIAAAVIALDLEAGYENARQAARILSERNLPGTYFVVTSLAEADPGTTAAVLAAPGEIATHTHLHLPLDTFPDREQMRLLERSRRTAEGISGKQVLGMRPPEERMRLSTLQAWADLGGLYVFAFNDMRSAAPTILPLMPDSLVLLARLGDGDYELLTAGRAHDRGAMVERTLSQLRRAVAYRGLFMFSYHTHLLAQPTLRPVLAAIADAVGEAPGLWTTTAGEVATWWLARDAVRVRVSEDGRTVDLENTAELPFRGGRLIVHLPDGTRMDCAPGELQRGRVYQVPIRSDATPTSRTTAAAGCELTVPVAGRELTSRSERHRPADDS